jgi:transposase
MWPGNTADVTSLLPVVDRLRRRFAIGRVCVVADRGMISAETIAALEARQLLYILGARERTDKLRFDGVFVLRTNTDLNPLAAMLRYKQLWTVERASSATLPRSMTKRPSPTVLRKRR